MCKLICIGLCGVCFLACGAVLVVGAAVDAALAFLF